MSIAQQYQEMAPNAYRRDIDGLRAISIIAVVTYHAFPTVVPGGFVGVDVFFVISGYLITKIISDGLAVDNFAISSFYARRIRRIFPALLVVLCTTYAVGWIVLLPSDFKRLAENIVGGAGFFSNLLQLRDANYFDPDALTNPLLHLWSLGIEEQFYILWPLLLIVCNGPRRFIAMTLIIAILSMGTNLYLVISHQQTAAFYSPISRAWELLIGALALQRETRNNLVISGFRRNVAGGIGILLIIGASLLLDKTSKYPGWWALIPTLGTLLLLNSTGSIVNRHLLSHPKAVIFGLISYPLYLWHWPLLTYLGILRNDNPNSLEIVVTIVISIMLAWATYRFIESPVRQRGPVTIYLAAGMTSIGVIGLCTIVGNGFGFRFPSQVRDIAALRTRISSKNNTGFREACFLDRDDSLLTPRGQCIESGKGPLIFVWGDSTAATLYPGLKKEQQFNAFRIAQFTAASCAPVVDSSEATVRSTCAEINDQTLGFVKASAPDIVLLHAMWNEKSDFDNLHNTISQLKYIGVPRIVILGPVPVWKRELPFDLVNAYRWQRSLPNRMTSGVAGSSADAVMERFSNSQNVEYISAWHIFCNSEGCITRLGPSADDVVTWDNAHLSTRGSEFAVHSMITDLLPTHPTGPTGITR